MSRNQIRELLELHDLPQHGFNPTELSCSFCDAGDELSMGPYVEKYEENISVWPMPPLMKQRVRTLDNPPIYVIAEWLETHAPCEERAKKALFENTVQVVDPSEPSW